MFLYSWLGIISGACAVAAYVPYVYLTIRGKITPHPISWLLWAILGAVSLITYIAVGAHETLPLAIVSFIGPTLLFLLSVKKWKGRFGRFDYVCLAFSCVAILVYIIFHQAAFALSINLIGDFIAALPTIRKTYHDPSSENLSTWLLFTLSAVIALFALDHLTYGLVILPLYLVLFEGLMCVLVIRGRLKKTL